MKISELYIHPVKSLASKLVKRSEFDAMGLKHDRRWMVVDENDQFVTQRFIPEMCLLNATVLEDGLLLEVAGGDSLLVSQNNLKVARSVTVWGDQCRSLDAGDEAAEWLSGFLKSKVRLVYFPDDEYRQVDLEYAKQGDHTGFSDGFPLLVISQASLDDLNSRLDSKVEMLRFRPNIVVEGCEPFAEDSWKVIEINGVAFRVVKPCSRCSIPSINPLTAGREAEPTRTLRSYRMRNGKVYFGQNVIPDGNGVLEVGMSVTVLE